MPTPFVMYRSAIEGIAKADIDLEADSFKLVLSNTAPDQATDVNLTDCSEIASGGGYSSGGYSLTVASRGFLTGTDIWVLDFNDYTITASGGAVATWRYRILRDSTANRVIGYWDEGGAINIASGGTFDVTFDAGGVIRLGQGAI